MTEVEWLACEDPLRMLDWLTSQPGDSAPRHDPRRPEVSPRKLRLWVEACRREEERFKGRALYHEPAARSGDFFKAQVDAWASFVGDEEVPMRVRAALLREIVGNPFRPPSFGWRTVRAARDMSAAALESGASEEAVWFGDWLPTRAILSLAKCIYAERTFDRLPVLADMLEEAGCVNVALLMHLRESPNPCPVSYPHAAHDYCDGTPVTGRPPKGLHVRGCHVLDLLLGKE